MVYCDYVNCKTQKSYGVPRYAVPNDGRRDIWLLNSGNSYSSKLISNETIYICADHFEKKFVNLSSIRSRLSMDAIPNAHKIGNQTANSEIENNLNNENKENAYVYPGSSLSSNKPNTKRSRKVLGVPANSVFCANNSIPTASTITNIELGEFNQQYHGSSSTAPKTYKNVFKDFKGIEGTNVLQEQFPSPDHHPEDEKNLDSDEAESQRNRMPIDKLLQSPKKKILKPEAFRKAMSSDAIEEILEEKNKSVKTFIRTQLFHTKNQKWNSDEKELFLKFHYKAPSFYKYLQREGFALPSLRTIIRWYDLMKFDIGVSLDILHMLQQKLSEMDDVNKKCILVFDEMSIKNELEYNSKEDKVYGFEDFGEFGRVRSFANHALLLMLRGLNKSWKQIIGYYCGNVKGVQLAEIISSTIKILIQEGIEVVAIVCDQGAANRTAYNKLGVTKEQPYLTIMDHKIFCLYDIVHLFKSVRNNLLVSNILIDDDVVSWSIVKKLFYAENRVIRSMHKLTEAHIKPDTFQKMRVKLATQVFSYHVSTAIFAAASTKLFNEDDQLMAISTANFIFKLNKLFDNMNSTNKFSKNPDKCAVSAEQIDILANLNESLEWISKWKREKKGSVYCFNGLCQTIKGLLQLWDAIKGEKQQYLITSHLNSDCLENTISVVRNNRGSYEKNPSAFRLHKNLKQMCFYNIMAPDTTSYETSNCSVILNMVDVENFLNPDATDSCFNDQSLNSDDTMPQNLIPVLLGSDNIPDDFNNVDDAEDMEDSNQCESDDSDADMIVDDESQPDEAEPTINDMATTYFAGYVAHAILKISNCRECKEFMCKETNIKDINYEASENLIKNRQYETITNGGLVVPTKVFVEVTQKIINCFENNFEKVCFEHNVIKKLSDLSEPQIKLACLIVEHKNQLIMHTMRVLIRAKLKILNATAKNRKRKLRKFDIINHM